MKVLHCIPSMEGGGAERQLAYLATGLVRLGADVHVAVVARGPNWNRLVASGATIHELRARGPHDPRVFWQIVMLMRSVKPDIVQVWLRQMDILGGLAALALRTPFVVTERSSEGAYPPSLKHRLRLWLGGSAAAIVSNSIGGDRYWQARVRRSGTRLYLVPNAVPIEEIAAPQPPVPDVVRNARPFVLFAGRLEPEKNIETLLEAVRLALAHNDFDFVCCGVGPLHGRIVEWIERHHLAGRVTLMGYTPHLWHFMQQAALLLSASRFEGNPNVVLEAMASRCPLAVSDIPEHRALVDETTAVLAEASSAAQFAQAIEAILRDRDAARTRAELAFARVQQFAPAAIARKYLGIYNDVLGCQGARA